MSETDVQGWKTCTLKEFANVTTGTKDVNEGNPRGKYPFFTCARALSYSDVYSFDEEAILVAGNGVGVGNLHFYEGKFEAYQRTYVVREISCNARYLWHAMDFGLGKSIGLETVGTSIPYIKMENITEFEFQIPKNFDEQSRIATVLDDVDSLLASLDALIAKKKDIKQGAMQQLLSGKTRMPGLSGEWLLQRLGTHIRFQVGYPFPSEGFSSNPGKGLRLIKNRDLKSDDQIYYFTGAFLSEYLVEDGDLLVGMDGDFIPTIWRKGSALLNQRVGRVICDSNLDSHFISYALINSLASKQHTTGATTVKHLSHGDVEEIVLRLPAVSEQSAIAEVLLDMDTELDALVARREKTSLIRIGMMQELLTGRTRLI